MRTWYRLRHLNPDDLTRKWDEEEDGHVYFKRVNDRGPSFYTNEEAAQRGLKAMQGSWDRKYEIVAFSVEEIT